MTKFLPLTALCSLLAISVLTAQTNTGKLSLSASVGLVPTYHGKNAKTDVPPLSLQFGYDISQRFSLHGYVGYTAATSTPRVFSDGLISQVENKTTMFGLKAKFKKDFTESLDLYGGLMLGYSAFNTTEMDTRTGEEVNRDPDAPTPYNPNAPSGQVLYSGFVGAKYQLTHVVGVFAEVGYGVSLLSTGISFNF